MSMENFEDIVENAKKQELEIREAKERAKSAEDAYDDIAKASRYKDTKTIKTVSSLEDRHWKVEERTAPEDIVKNTPGITQSKDYRGYIAVIGFTNPDTGKSTTKTLRRKTFEEAVIARNEIAATLLRRKLIDFDRFRKLTSF